MFKTVNRQKLSLVFDGGRFEKQISYKTALFCYFQNVKIPKYTFCKDFNSEYPT